LSVTWSGFAAARKVVAWNDEFWAARGSRSASTRSARWCSA